MAKLKNFTKSKIQIDKGLGVIRGDKGYYFLVISCFVFQLMKTMLEYGLSLFGRISKRRIFQQMKNEKDEENMKGFRFRSDFLKEKLLIREEREREKEKSEKNYE